MRSTIVQTRLLRIASLATLAALCAAACGGDDGGTDIEVGGMRNSAGSAGQSTGARPNGSGGTSGGGMSGEGGMPEGGADPGDGGVAGKAGGAGQAGMSGGGKAGSGGMAGTGGGSAGGAGTAGTGGTGGTAGSGGMAGTGGAAGSGGMAGTGGMTGTSGTAGSGGMAGTGGSTNQSCGNGVKEGGEECDDMGPSRLCSDACETVSTPECVTCEQAGDCFASSDNCGGPVATPFTPQQVAICYDVVQCIQASNCLDGTGSLGKCYCGTLGTAACGAAPFNLASPGAPNGPCAAIMQLGNPGLTTNSAILGGLTNRSRPAGAAGQRLNCQKTDEACRGICGLQ